MLTQLIIIIQQYVHSSFVAMIHNSYLLIVYHSMPALLLSSVDPNYSYDLFLTLITYLSIHSPSIIPVNLYLD